MMLLALVVPPRVPAVCEVQDVDPVQPRDDRPVPHAAVIPAPAPSTATDTAMKLGQDMAKRAVGETYTINPSKHPYLFMPAANVVAADTLMNNTQLVAVGQRMAAAAAAAANRQLQGALPAAPAQHAGVNMVERDTPCAYKAQTQPLWAQDIYEGAK